MRCLPCFNNVAGTRLLYIPGVLHSRHFRLAEARLWIEVLDAERQATDAERPVCRLPIHEDSEHHMFGYSSPTMPAANALSALASFDLTAGGLLAWKSDRKEVR